MIRCTWSGAARSDEALNDMGVSKMAREIDPGELNEVLGRRRDKRQLVLFLDFDGTLTPIVAHPDHAVLDEDMRRAVERLAGLYPVYIISGRGRDEVCRLVGVEGAHFVGSHGFDMLDSLPGLDRELLDEAVPELEASAKELEHWLDYIDGILIERKKYSFALHYRRVDSRDLQQIHAAAEDVMERYGAVTTKRGKKVIEFVPDIPWDKGRCVQALLARIEDETGGSEWFAVYIGDDLTDEDAFRALEGAAALTVLIAAEARDSAAGYRLPDSDAVRAFLQHID